MIYTKVNGNWEPCIPTSKDSGTWKEALDFEKRDGYWDVKVEIYPSPFQPITDRQSIKHPEFEGTVNPLHSQPYYSYQPSSNYTDPVSGVNINFYSH